MIYNDFKRIGKYLKNPIKTYQQAGVYNVVLQVTTTAGCVASYARSLNAAAPPNIGIGYADGSQLGAQPLSLFRNDTIRLKAIGIFDSIYWNGRKGNQNYNITRVGTYTAAGYRSGCMSATSVSVVLNDQPYDPALRIQNILTPNGDGFNDVWEISMLNNIRPAKVSVYTRAGLPVLETLNYNNDWKGMYLNNPLPEGSYFYIIEGANGEVFNGSITLMR